MPPTLHILCLLLVLVDGQHRTSTSSTSTSAEELTKSFVRVDPSRWGGGWVRADAKPETAQYFHPFAAYVDERVERLPALLNRSTDLATTGGRAYRKDAYIRILLTGQEEHLPSFYDTWDNKFLENLLKCTCRLYYDTPNATLSVPVVAVVPSPFDYSWYPASFSSPYSAYCLIPLSRPGLAANASRPVTAAANLPVAVSLVPQNPHQHNLFMPLHGKDDSGGSFLDNLLSSTSPASSSASASASNQTINNKAKTLAACVGPLSGIDFLTNEYDDIDAMIAIFSYFSSVLGVSKIYLYNPIMTRDHVTGTAFHSWMHHLLYILKKSNRMMKEHPISVELVPDVTKYRQRWHQTRHLDPNEHHRHTAHIFPTLFTETCNHLALAAGHDYLLVADYNDFLVLHGEKQKQHESLVSFLQTMDQQHPKAGAYAFKSAVFLDRPVVNVTLHTDQNQDQLLFADCADKVSHVAELLCKHKRLDVDGAEVGRFSRTRHIVKPTRVDELSPSGVVLFSGKGYETVSVPWDEAGVHKYAETTYLKTQSNSGRHVFSREVADVRSLDPGRAIWAVASSVPHTPVLRGVGVDSGVDDRSMLYYRSHLLNSTVYRHITGAFNPMELAHYSASRHEITNTTVNDFGHPTPVHAQSKARRVLMFSAVSTKFSSDDAYRRTQLAVMSWLRLASYAPDKVLLRVLLLADDKETCSSLKYIHLKPGCNEHSGKPFNPFNESFTAGEGHHSAGTPQHHTHHHHHHHHANNVTSVTTETSDPAATDSILCLPVTHCLHPEHSIPTVDCVYKTAIAAAIPGEYLFFSNSDVSYGADLIDTLLGLVDKPELKEGFVGLGRRWNFQLSEEDLCGGGGGGGEGRVVDTDQRLKLIRQKFKENGRDDTNFAMDYFFLSQSSFPRNLPPFLIGRANWDNILAFWMLANSWRALVPPSLFDAHNNTFIYFAGRGNVSAASVLSGPPLVSLSSSVFAAHMSKIDDDFYTYSKRSGSDWAIRLLTDWKRLEIGNIDTTNYYLKEPCSPAAECVLLKREYIPTTAPTQAPTSKKD